MMTKTVAGVLVASLLAGSAGCGKKKHKKAPRWDAPVVEQTRDTFPVCWSDLSNIPCVTEAEARRGVLHLPAVETGVVRTENVLLIARQGNGDWRVQRA